MLEIERLSPQLFIGENEDITSLLDIVWDTPIDYIANARYLQDHPAMWLDEPRDAFVIGASLEAHVSSVLESLGYSSRSFVGRRIGAYMFHQGNSNLSIIVTGANMSPIFEADAIIQIGKTLLIVEVKTGKFSGLFMQPGHLETMKHLITLLPEYRDCDVASVLITLEPKHGIEYPWWDQFRQKGGIILPIESRRTFFSNVRKEALIYGFYQ